MNRFDYVKYDEQAQKTQDEFKTKIRDMEHLVEKHLGQGRASALVLTKLEEAYMWVGKQIRDDQLKRNGHAELQEGRKNG